MQGILFDLLSKYSQTCPVKTVRERDVNEKLWFQVSGIKFVTRLLNRSLVFVLFFTIQEQNKKNDKNPKHSNQSK